MERNILAILAVAVFLLATDPLLTALGWNGKLFYEIIGVVSVWIAYKVRKP